VQHHIIRGDLYGVGLCEHGGHRELLGSVSER
jgi:hypothetical protein